MLRVQFINLGVKVLSRSEAKGVDCEFRLVQDVSLLIFVVYLLIALMTACHLLWLYRSSYNQANDRQYFIDGPSEVWTV
jgi:hypothetical protein